MTEDRDAERRRKGRERQRRYRQRKRAERERAAVVVELDPAKRDSDRDTVRDGSVTEAVRAEVGDDTSPLAALAVRMAEILDDPWCAPQAPAAAKVLRDLLAQLREPQASTGALSRIRAARVEREAGR